MWYVSYFPHVRNLNTNREISRRLTHTQAQSRHTVFTHRQPAQAQTQTQTHEHIDHTATRTHRPHRHTGTQAQRERAAYLYICSWSDVLYMWWLTSWDEEKSLLAFSANDSFKSQWFLWESVKRTDEVIKAISRLQNPKGCSACDYTSCIHGAISAPNLKTNFNATEELVRIETYFCSKPHKPHCFWIEWVAVPRSNHSAWSQWTESKNMAASLRAIDLQDINKGPNQVGQRPGHFC